MTHSDSDNVVSTTAGALEGTEENGLRVFRGVPFAQPPVGKYRFRSPQPLAPWEGIRSAKKAGPASFQMNLQNAEDVLARAEAIDPGVPGIPAWPGYVGKTYNQENISEDCLYLDIWVPKSAPGKKLPVYVYYHGGANAVSSGSFEIERGENLAVQENIIVVRPNYRMGALGWVHFGLISDQFPEAINLGFKDQVAALAWVHANIEAFGGDSENITIGGESAGATAVSHLLTYPGSRKYFKRAIIQSLSPFNVWCTQQHQEAVTVAEKYLELLSITDSSQLKNVDPSNFLAVQSVLTRYFDADDNVAWRPLGGVIDHDWIPEAPAQFLSQPASAAIAKPLMIGFAKDEWQFFRGHAKTIKDGTKAEARAVLDQVYGEEHAEALFTEYQKLFPDHVRPGHILSDIMSFEFFKFSSLAIAKAHSANGVSVHVFEFAYELPGWGGDLRALHTGDMPFLWRNLTDKDLAQWPSFDGVDRADVERVSKKVGKLYAQFIRNGEPGSEWQAFTPEKEAILWFGETVESKNHLLSDEWKVFTKYGAPSVLALEDLLVDNLRKKLLPR